ncbi:MAG: SAM-dependent methyltransferase [Chlamydiota bacterium]
MTKILYLLPNLLGENDSFEEFFPPIIKKILPTLDGLFVESEKEGRRFLSHFLPREQWTKIKLKECNEHTLVSMKEEMIKPLVDGETWGLISDAGLPCIADPGSWLVLEARKRGIDVQAIPGPSSIFLALMSSGLPAQSFLFHGYLPREENELRKKLLLMEKNSIEKGMTHLWMETPYRVEKMCHMALRVFHPNTLFCVAQNLLQPTERVIVKPIRLWEGIRVENVPSIFLIYASNSTAMWS